MATYNGTTGNDTLRGTTANDILYGLEGNDSLLGNGGEDSIYGGLGDDTLYHVTGDPTIATASASILYEVDEGTGNTTLVFRDYIEYDLVNDSGVKVNPSDPSTLPESELAMYFIPSVDFGESGTDNRDVVFWIYGNGNVNTATTANNYVVLVDALSAEGELRYLEAITIEQVFFEEYGGTRYTYTKTVTISMDEVAAYFGTLANTDPIAVDDVNSVVSTDVVTGNVLTNDSDPDAGDTLSISTLYGTAFVNGARFILASGATVRMFTDGTYSYDTNGAFDYLAPSEVGYDTFTYGITDGLGGDATATVVITVTGYDDGIVTGTSGDDLLQGSVVANVITGLEGNDTIYGEESKDTIYGGAGNDLIYGGDQADYIEAGADNDTVDGGYGRDYVLLGDGDDVFTDTNDQTNSLGNDTVNGEAGNDTIYGGGGNDDLSGGKDDDYIEGGQGQDLLRGNKGNDVLFGNNGADTLIGGEGDDTMGGGVGADTFAFGANFGNDLIRDFNLAEDILRWNVDSVVHSLADLTASLVSLDGKDYVLIEVLADPSSSLLMRNLTDTDLTHYNMEFI